MRRRLALALVLPLAACFSDEGFVDSTGAATQATQATDDDPSATSTTKGSTAAETSGPPDTDTDATTSTTDPSTTSTTDPDTTSTTDPDTTTAAPCEPGVLELPAVRDAFFATGPESICTMTFGGPCTAANLGVTPNFEVGTLLLAFSITYAVDFDLAAALESAGVALAQVQGARLRLRLHAKDDEPVPEHSYRVAAIAAQDAWFEGTKNMAKAVIGDSSYEARQITMDQILPWSGGKGPDSGGPALAKLLVPAGSYAQPSAFESEPIPLELLVPGLPRGLVVARPDAAHLRLLARESPGGGPVLLVDYCK